MPNPHVSPGNVRLLLRRQGSPQSVDEPPPLVCTTASSLHVWLLCFEEERHDSEGEKGEAARGHRSCGGGLSGRTRSGERRSRGWRRDDGTPLSSLETVALAASSSSLFFMSRRPVRSSCCCCCCWLRRHQESA